MNIKKLNEELGKVLNEIDSSTIAKAQKASQEKIAALNTERDNLQAKFDADMKELQAKQNKETERQAKFSDALEKRRLDGYYLEVIDAFDAWPLSPWGKRFLDKEEALNIFNSLTTEEEWINYANDNNPEFPIENVLAVEYSEVYAGKVKNNNIKFFDDEFKKLWKEKVE